MSGTDFYLERVVRGRKPHRCEFCGHFIPVGSSHLSARGVLDGHWYTYRLHHRCNRATAKLLAEMEWVDASDEVNFFDLMDDLKTITEARREARRKEETTND